MASQGSGDIMQFFPNLSSSVDVNPAEWAKAREQEGWAGVVASDHLWTEDRCFPHLWVSLTAMAMATSRLKLSSSFSNNLFRSPVEFAHASLTLQFISGGRFDAGLGAGWSEEELTRTGREYPRPGVRLEMYREAMTIARSLFTNGACQFSGQHYSIDVDNIGPTPKKRPALVASCGGKKSIRIIAPLADRIEVMAPGRAVRGGALSIAALSEFTENDLRELVDRVKCANEKAPIGFFAILAVGDAATTRALRDPLGDGLFSDFVGEPAFVADNLRRLEDFGIDRVQITSTLPGSFEALAPLLNGSSAMVAFPTAGAPN
jgi:alkanesulfonate monooxygenase SsuD/methylene tetrahydromethanopterin reductase-like flavin-dependent oxidoreductase (luciferase family)